MREDPNKHNYKLKRRDYNWNHRNKKYCKKLLQRTVCQEIWKPRRDGHFLEEYNLPKLNEEKAENLNRPITADEIEAVIKKLPTHKIPAPDGFTEFYKIYKEELTPIIHRLFKTFQGDGRLPISF